MRPSLLWLASVVTRLRYLTFMAHGVHLWCSLAVRGLTDSAQYMEKVQKDGSSPRSVIYLRVGPALFFMSSYFTICQRQTVISWGPWVDAKLFTVHSSCTEEPVFVTFLYTLLQLSFLELSPLCASLKIAGSAIVTPRAFWAETPRWENGRARTRLLSICVRLHTGIRTMALYTIGGASRDASDASKKSV